MIDEWSDPRSVPGRRPTEQVKRSGGAPVHAQAGHLKHAPIIEALIDLKVEFPPGVGLEQLAAVQARFRSEYPDRRNRIGWAGRFELGDETAPPVVPEKRIDGYYFQAPGRNRIVQLRLDGFAVHWMRPYDTWDALLEETRARWYDVRQELNPVRVTKIAVRYINRIDVPMPVTHLQDWLLTSPEVAPALGRPMSQFFMQITLPFPEKGANCVVSQAVERDREGFAGFIFDIDVTRAHEFAVEADTIWRCLGDLRAIKNEVFFKSITPKTKRLFE